MDLDHVILAGLVQEEGYCREVLPFLKEEYFLDQIDCAVFEAINRHISTYTNLPNKTLLQIELQKDSKLAAKQDEVKEALDAIFTIDLPEDKQWMIQQTEEFCQNKAIYNAIMTSISIYDGSEKQLSYHAIPELLKEAVSVSFDKKIGMDLFEGSEERFEFYTKEENRVPFDIELLNTITNGGVIRKTLNMLIAGINVGKTMGMIHLACSYLQDGLNVLYVTLEMREEEILRRVDANLLKTPINNIEKIKKDVYLGKINEIRQKTLGTLKVKEYPMANVAHIKHLLSELRIKQKFVPDIIFVDYIGIMDSYRIRAGSQNSHFFLKSIAEELRALAAETDTVVWTAMQLTRDGIRGSDPEITDVGESIGIPATADFILSVSRTEELDQLSQLMLKQIKNRYGKKTTYLRFLVGVDVDTQTLYDVSQPTGGAGITPDENDEEIVRSTKNIKEKFAALNSFE
jgi:replicative DNA helicase